MYFESTLAEYFDDGLVLIAAVTAAYLVFDLVGAALRRLHVKSDKRAR